ncbi:Actin cytoskeleton-regulatory complex protein pan1-like 1, partial [Homarus americanus]
MEGQPSFLLPQLDGPADHHHKYTPSVRTKNIVVGETFVPFGSAQTSKHNAVILEKAQHRVAKPPPRTVSRRSASHGMARTKCGAGETVIEYSYSDSDYSDAEDFVIPQFDGANDIISRKGRRQQASRGKPNATPQRQSDHNGRSAPVNTRDVIRENILKKKRGREGSRAPQHQGLYATSPSVPYSTASQGPVPSSLNSVPGNSSSSLPSDLNIDGMLQLPDFMDISSRMTDQSCGSASQSNTYSQTMNKSSRGSRKAVDQPPVSGTMNITPLPNIGMNRMVPGIGNALVVPALITNSRVNVSGLDSSQMVLPHNYLQQQHGNLGARESPVPAGNGQQPSGLVMVPRASSPHDAGSSQLGLHRTPNPRGQGGRNSASSQSHLRQPGVNPRNSNQRQNYHQIPSQSHKGSRRHYPADPPIGSPQHPVTSSRSGKYVNAGSQQAAERGTQETVPGVSGPAKTMLRQNSEQSAYSPISDESDADVPNTCSGRKLAGNGDATAGDSTGSEPAHKEDILKQAFDMILFDGIDIEVEPMDAADGSLQSEPNNASEDSAPMQRSPRLCPDDGDFGRENVVQVRDSYEAESVAYEETSTRDDAGERGATDGSYWDQDPAANTALKETSDGSSTKLNRKDKREKIHNKHKNLRSEAQHEALTSETKVGPKQVSGSSSGTQSSRNNSGRSTSTYQSRASSFVRGGEVRSAPQRTAHRHDGGVPDAPPPRRSARADATETDPFDVDYDLTPHTPGSFLPAHDRSPSPAPAPRPPRPGMSATTKAVHPSVQRRKLSDVDNSDWYHDLDCPPTPGNPLKESWRVQEEASTSSGGKKEAKSSNSKHSASKPSPSSSDTSQATDGSSGSSKKKSRKKIAILFGSFSPPASPVEPVVDKMKSLAVEPTGDSFDSDYENNTPDRPQTPGREVGGDHSFNTPPKDGSQIHNKKQRVHDCFFDFDLNSPPERPVTPGGSHQVQDILSGEQRSRPMYQQFESVFDTDFMPHTPLERPRTPGGGSSTSTPQTSDKESPHSSGMGRLPRPEDTTGSSLLLPRPAYSSRTPETGSGGECASPAGDHRTWRETSRNRTLTSQHKTERDKGGVSGRDSFNSKRGLSSTELNQRQNEKYKKEVNRPKEGLRNVHSSPSPGEAPALHSQARLKLGDHRSDAKDPADREALVRSQFGTKNQGRRPKCDRRVEQTAHRDVPHSQATHRVVPHSQAAHRDVPHNQAAHRDVPHSQATHRVVPHSQATHRDGPHSQATHRVVPHSQQPTEMFPTTKQPTEMFPTARQPTEMFPTVRQPTEMFPTARQPTEMFPTARQHTGMVPTARQHTGMVPTARQHTGMVPTARQHTGMVPTARQHTGMVPTARQHTGMFPTARQHTGMVLKETVHCGSQRMLMSRGGLMYRRAMA